MAGQEGLVRGQHHGLGDHLHAFASVTLCCASCCNRCMHLCNAGALCMQKALLLFYMQHCQHPENMCLVMQTSRSGRVRYPPLAFWMCETKVHDRLGGAIAIERPGSNRHPPAHPTPPQPPAPAPTRTHSRPLPPQSQTKAQTQSVSQAQAVR